jgi:hypothetical protein
MEVASMIARLATLSAAEEKAGTDIGRTPDAEEVTLR